MNANIPRVRRAYPDETEDLTRLAVRSKAHWGYSREFLAAAHADLAVDTARIGTGRVFVVERNAELIGFCSLELSAATPDRAELIQCFVHPDWMGQNYGRLLWNYTVRKLRSDYPAVSRLVVVSDPNAVGFYQKCGARPDGYEASIADPKRLLPRLVYEIPPKSARQ
ncbi:MAG: GNAT family N-acetyltransferase [Leptospirales bacterium]